MLIKVIGIEGELDKNIFRFTNLDPSMHGEHEFEVSLIDEKGQISNFTLLLNFEFIQSIEVSFEVPEVIDLKFEAVQVEKE